VTGGSAAGEAVRARLWAGVAGLVVVGVLVQIVAGSPDASLDLEVYRSAVADAVAGRPLYAADLSDGVMPWLYPPSAVLVLAPLAVLPLGITAVLWALVSAWFVVAVVRHARVLVGRPADDVVAWRLVAWALAASCIWFGLVLGQVGALLLALAAVGVLVRRPWAPALLGVAVAVKITPGLLVVWLLLAGRRRDAAVATGAWAVLTAAAWAILPEDSEAFWLDGVATQVERTVGFAATANQSLAAWVFRLTGAGSGALVAACTVLVSAAALAAAWRLRGRAPVTAVAVVGVATAAAAPVGWTHQWVWLPVLVVAVVAEIGGRAVTAWAWGTGVLALVPLLETYREVLPTDPLAARLVSGPYLVATAGLVVAAVVEARRTAGAPDRAPTG